MGSSCLRKTLLLAALTNLVMGLGASDVHAQLLPFFRPRSDCPPVQLGPPCVDPAKPPSDDLTTPPKVDMTTPPATDIPQPGPITTAAFSPNMIGDLLGAGNSLSYFYQRAQGPQKVGPGFIPAVVINGTGATNVTNPSVAENNTAIPQDRVSFRFNYFNNALSVVGDSGQTVPLGSVLVGTTLVPVNKAITTTRNYDVNEYTFAFEKTFLDGNFSVEMRVPFASTLSHTQNFSVADIVGFGSDAGVHGGVAEPGDHLVTSPTPDKTFGQTDTEFGNITLILKGLIYQSETFAFSGGLAFGIPTARGYTTQVTDYVGDTFDYDTQAQRIRTFNIANETWNVSPFIAFLAKPTERLFFQGFVQYDQPLNPSRVTYSEIVTINAEPNHIPITPVSVATNLYEQSLLHVDLGMGGWLMRDPERTWLTGIAPTVEIHYTTTTTNADIIQLPASALVKTTTGPAQTEPNPTIGNLRNRVDILDLTLGTTFLLKDRATVAAGFTLPLRTGDNRTFDYEVQVQLNYYFGAPRSNRFTPNQ